MSFIIEKNNRAIALDDTFKERLSDYHSFIPLYSYYFPDTKDSEWNSFSLNYNNKITSIKSTEAYNTFKGSLENTEDTVDIFAKFCPLFDPVRYMIGKVDSEKLSIPTSSVVNHDFLDMCRDSFLISRQ